MSGIITHISAISSCFKRGGISYYIEPEEGETLAKIHRKLARAAKLTGKRWKFLRVDGALCVKPKKKG